MPNNEPLLVMIKDTPYLLRPAQPADATAVAALSAQIWGGDDYVPYVFDDWVADEVGEFTVVYEGERLAGFGKLSQLGPTEWWLEGLRVDPAYRGRGVARAMHHHIVDLFDHTGRGMLRFATEAENTPMHKLAAETSFHFVSQHYLTEAPALPTGSLSTGNLSAGTPAALEPVTTATLPEFQQRLLNSPIYQAMAGLIEDDWVWLELAPRLAGYQEAGRLFWWQRPAGAVIIRLAEPELLWLNYLDGPADSLSPILAAVQALAAHQGATKIEGKPLAAPVINVALAAAGWQVNEHQMRLYERPHHPPS
jgi:GNAT superfamily N-acetyltransferase